VALRSDRRNELYWTFVNRHPIAGRLTKLAFSAFVIMSGMGAAYAGAILLADAP
jgi:hypothetical protein